jgi:hypothetical protein
MHSTSRFTYSFLLQIISFLFFLVGLTICGPLPLQGTYRNVSCHDHTQSPAPATGIDKRVEARNEDWATNIEFMAGTQFLGLFLQPDGQVHDLNDVTCLLLPSYTEGPCTGISVSSIGVATGYGSCTFYGSDGAIVAVPGQGAGWVYVAPPQNIMQVVCG